MSHDALFQLGMGVSLLNASQKEDTFGPRVCDTRAEAVMPAPRVRHRAPPACFGGFAARGLHGRRAASRDLRGERGLSP